MTFLVNTYKKIMIKFLSYSKYRNAFHISRVKEKEKSISIVLKIVQTFVLLFLSSLLRPLTNLKSKDGNII